MAKNTKAVDTDNEVSETGTEVEAVSAKKEFEKMLADIEGEIPLTPAEAKGAEKFLDNLAILKGLGSKPSMSSVAASGNANFLAKVKHGNSSVGVLMPPVAITDWLVQVYPDDDNILHFQAKSTSAFPSYARWYKLVGQAVYDAVMAAYESGTKRKSFYSESEKQYLICTRVGAAAVEIPGYGVVEVPELFQ